MKVEICFLLFVLHFHHHLALEHVEAQQHHHKVKIGVLVPVTHDVRKVIKDYTHLVNQFNLAHLDQNRVTYHLDFGFSSLNDSFLTIKSVCSLMQSGVASVFGEDLGAQGDLAGSVLNFFNIPFVQANPSLLWDQEKTQFGQSLNLFPSRKFLSRMMLDLLNQMKVESVAIFFFEQSDILLWKQFIDQKSDKNFVRPRFIHISAHHADFEIMSLLQELKTKYTSYVLLNFFTPALDERFLRLCQLSGVMVPKNQLILTTLSLSERVLKPYMYLGTNVTFPVLDQDEDTETVEGVNIQGLSEDHELSHSLIHDFFQLLHSSLTSDDLMTLPVSTSCQSTQSWAQGKSVVKKMKKAQFWGKSGLVKFDALGDRSEISVSIRQLTQSGHIETVGAWTRRTGLLWKGVKSEPASGSGKPVDIYLKGRKTLVISTVLSDPYTMLKLDAKSAKREGLDRYEGFVIDLATLISQLVGFNFTIHISDGYGSKDGNGQWNGMIRDLLEERADLAMGDLTINYDREQVVDFTMPFLDLGISLLYVKSPEKSVNLLSFMSPLSPFVWLLMVLAGFFVSLTMYWIARLSPYETEDLDSKDGESPFRVFIHCCWFSIASWVQQGCDFLPRAMSSRTVASFWWFFTLIMISSYTANLAAFLTIERLESPIASAGDLAKQSKIKYGSVSSGSTAAFFKDSKDEDFAKLGRVMQRDKEEVMVDSNSEGVNKVITENGLYAFFMESTSIAYLIERNCQLQKIGGNLDSKSYGIALPQGSPLRAAISSAIIKLNEEGKILELREKWWKKERGGGSCSDEDESSSVNALTMTNVGGIFLVLLVGLVLGGAMALVEHFWERFKRIFRS